MNCIEKQLKAKRYLFIFTTVILLAFAVLNPYLWIREEIRWRNVQTWQKLPATVVSHQKVETGRGKSKTTYSNITYRYEVNQKVCFGNDSGLGGRNLLPEKFHSPGAQVHCYFNPATGKTMLDHRPDNQWIYLLGLLFFGGFVICNIIAFAKLKKFDSRTVPAEFAGLLQPVPELPPRLTVRGHFIYKTMLDDPAIPGKVFYAPKKNFLQILQITVFMVVFAVLILAAYISSNWGLVIFALLQLVPIYFCLRPAKVMVLNTDSRSIYFTAKKERMLPAKKAIPFSGVQACYLVWMTKSDSMGILLQTAGGNLVIGCKDGQQLMREAAQIVNIIHPQLPVYDLIHRDHDPKKQQGYIII